MKAIVFTKYGSPDVLELKEVEKPTLKDDEVLIRVHAASLNDWDWEALARDGPYTLGDVPQAFRHFGTGRHKGKVVITLNSGG